MFGDLTRVGANFHAMESWSNLKKVNGKIGQIQSRLSTGKRINSAEDDTSGYALSKHLESRVRGLSQALDNVGTAKNVLNIGEGGYQAQMSILQTVKEKLTQAADGSFSTAQRGAIGDQIESLLKEFDDISDDTLFNDNALFNLGDDGMTFQVGEDKGDELQVVFHASGRNSVAENTTNLDFNYLAVGDDKTVTAAVTSDGVSDDLASGTVSVAIDGLDETDDYTVDTATGIVTFGADAITAGSYTIEYTYNSSDNGDAYTTTDDSEVVELRGEWSSLTQDQAQSAISTFDSAIKSLAKSIQSLGDSNARLSSKEESLSLAISNTEATRSRIEDADFAKEQMSMMRLQILQQTTVGSFAQSNSAPQMVLSLFR